MVKTDGWVFLLLPMMLGALYMAFVGSPDDAVLGASQRIFYVHMGTATAAGIAFTITAASSMGYLVTRKMSYDLWAASAAEVGTLFTTMLLISGVLWGRAAWGVWWTWDPRLTATLILWVLFLGYLLLREWSDTREKRARLSAVLALVAYLDVPLDYMTIRWWKSIHPVVITAHGIQMAPVMMWTMFFSMGAFVFLLGAYMVLRMRILRAELLVDDVKLLVREHLGR